VEMFLCLKKILLLIWCQVFHFTHVWQMITLLW
jgi:hypothetical protein